MENYFQTLGNKWMYDNRSPTGYMEGTEFHGPLVGFLNISLHNRGIKPCAETACGYLPNMPSIRHTGALDKFRWAELSDKHAGTIHLH